MSDDIIDVGDAHSAGETPQAVKTLAILSIIGSSLWSLLILIGLLAINMMVDMLNDVIPVADPTGLVVLLVVILLVMLVLNILGIVGAIKMNKGQKSGFILYAIVTGIWALLLLMGASEWLNLVSALASIGFIVAFGMQLKNLK
ncbi:MAG: hypothetical protein MI810_24760 [Flavobacteriales bacterium]|nr:hypothetical protein [Flavobacteriales bacterium]